MIKISLTPAERSSYNQLRDFARAQLAEFQRHNQVVSKTIQILQLLIPLQQACSAGTVNMEDLREKVRVLQALEEADKNKKLKEEQAVGQPYNDVRGECSICLDIIDEALMTACRHVSVFQNK